MASYVCLIYGKDDRVITAEYFDLPDNDAATRKAETLSVTCDGARGFELWNGGSKVATTLPTSMRVRDGYERVIDRRINGRL